MQTLIKINRHAPPPAFPEWVIRWNSKDSQTTGPEVFDMNTIAGFEVPDAAGDWVESSALFKYLLESTLIGKCLNLQDGHALIAHEEFKKPRFCNKWTLLWRSTALDVLDNIFVPYIQNVGTQTPIIYWYWLGYKLYLPSCLGLLQT